MATTTTSRRSIDIINQFAEEVFNEGNLDRIADLSTEDFVQHGPMSGMELRGIEAAQENIEGILEGFSDIEQTVDLAFSDPEGEYVCAYFTTRGTHDGEFMGVPATNEEVELNGMGIYRIDDGRVAEAWIMADFLGLFQQLGVVEELDVSTR